MMTLRSSRPSGVDEVIYELADACTQGWLQILMELPSIPHKIPSLTNICEAKILCHAYLGLCLSLASKYQIFEKYLALRILEIVVFGLLMKFQPCQVESMEITKPHTSKLLLYGKLVQIELSLFFLLMHLSIPTKFNSTSFESHPLELLEASRYSWCNEGIA